MNDQEFWELCLVASLAGDRTPVGAASDADLAVKIRRERMSERSSHGQAAAIIRRLMGSDACASEINDDEIDVLIRAAEHLEGKAQ